MGINRLATFVLALGLAGCMGEPTRGVNRPFASACDAANEGLRIAVRGYFRLPDSNEGNYGVTLNLYGDPAFDGTPIAVLVPFGAEPHHVASIPPTYTDDDLVLHLADGTEAGYGTGVRVSGRMYYGPRGVQCALENPYLEPAGQES